jgi:hypothetical protein
MEFFQVNRQKLLHQFFFISDLSSLIEVATGPITGDPVLYSLLSVILIGPITAKTELDINIAEITAIRTYFLLNIMTPINKIKRGI